MKRRKKSGPPTGHASRVTHVAIKRPVADDIVAVLTEQAGESEIRKKAVAAGERRRNGRVKSKQPPLSEEMKTVTEIGSRRWKPGQTK
jgi:hypothetical protein